MPDTNFWVSFIWIGAVFAASVVYRLGVGKPIRPHIPHEALFSERRAGGRWASNCLLVSITPSELKVEPSFPFNLMFLPEIWGLEHRVRLSDIKGAEVFRGLLMNTKIELISGKMIPLKLRRPNSFLQELELAVSQNPK